MASNEYYFITHWRVRGTVDEVYDILIDGPDLVRWWPSVYLDVQELAPGDAEAVGRVVSLYTKGWLPYTLRWQFRIVAAQRPSGFTLEAWGDFVGRGTWHLTKDGDWVDITYDWRVCADKPLLRTLSFLLKPVFSANHRWAMAQGERSLRLELARRHAITDEERARIPAPPGPTPTAPMLLLFGTVAVLAGGDGGSVHAEPPVLSGSPCPLDVAGVRGEAAREVFRR